MIDLKGTAHCVLSYDWFEGHNNTGSYGVIKVKGTTNNTVSYGLVNVKGTTTLVPTAWLMWRAQQHWFLRFG